ncbi:hypothetical protein TSAR_003730 [Trichomalopsis sarcophagae]|uniref:F-box domain-containing protein n=1 Tax=Trichomalopsis sarcophagae TaxID=543379 RepID=A0A232EM41_9HYME|nr:hypothetical protein TSAR_003730 [Trichomalopsis sarcophagae]
METRAKSKRARLNEIVGSWNPDVEVAINKLNDDCLIKIFMFLPIVDRVRIEGVCKRWRNISKESWQHFKTLKADLAIWGSDVVFCSPNVLKKFRQLKEFSFMRSVCSKLSDPFPRIIHSLPTTLKILEMSNLIFSNIDCIGKMNDLEKLTIYKEDLVTDTFLVTLAENCKKLYHLDISGAKNVTESGIQAITSLPEIKHLVLNYLPEITGYNFTYMPKLQTLCCRGCEHLKDDGLCTLLTMCDLIEFMDLYGCEQITNVLLKCALNVAKTRTNNLVLHLILSQDGLFDLRPIYSHDTLLKITLLTERESRDEDEDWLFWLL